MSMLASANLDERVYVKDLLERIVERCPRRQATSEDERRATLLVREEFEALDLDTSLEHFRFNDNLYANLALHFGIGTAGSLVSGLSPVAGFALHTLAGTSYFMDSTRRAFLLRRLFPFKPSQNLLVTLPATSSPELRIVLLAHIDAAFSGLLFDPRARLITLTSPERLPSRLSFLGRTLAVPTYSQFLLAGIDVLKVLLGPLSLPLMPVEALLSVPGLLAFLINLQMVVKNEIVPGANDNLSAVAAIALLARRLQPVKPGCVELVFVVTGAEEASMGGAQALVEEHTDDWERDRTVVIALDGLASGDLRRFEEGEVWPAPSPGWLVDVSDAVAASDGRFGPVSGFQIPSGATDALPFLMKGYDAVSFGCVDPALQTPRHYHMPSDTPENVDPDDVVMAVDFTEKLIREIVRRRLPGVVL
ncbi:MAG: M20/M25/M40 family metallo-hydrolase [Deltaproteobacteria bacterium]|nr:M20/M25/M40 family metallo-hydrolase [Deltaproteobacteria bacterium]